MRRLLARVAASTWFGLGTLIGLAVIGWLLLSSTTTSFYPGPSGDIVCTAVLNVPFDAREVSVQGQDRTAASNSDSDPRTAVACEDIRNRSLALSLVVAIPTAVAWTLTVLALREERRRRDATA